MPFSEVADSEAIETPGSNQNDRIITYGEFSDHVCAEVKYILEQHNKGSTSAAAW